MPAGGCCSFWMIAARVSEASGTRCALLPPRGMATACCTQKPSTTSNPPTIANVAMAHATQPTIAASALARADPVALPVLSQRVPVFAQHLGSGRGSRARLCWLLARRAPLAFASTAAAIASAAFASAALASAAALASVALAAAAALASAAFRGALLRRDRFGAPFLAIQCAAQVIKVDLT